MNEGNTKELTVDEKLDLMLIEARRTNDRLTGVETEVASLNTRFTKLEEKVEDRLKDTRPIWQAIHAQTEKIIEDVAQLKEGLARVEARQVVFEDKMDDLIDGIAVLSADVIEVRGGADKIEETSRRFRAELAGTKSRLTIAAS